MNGYDADVVVVGGGLAGLTAGWRLRDLDVAVLEGQDRVGGRIRSQPAGPYPLNWGAHVFAGPASATGVLLDDVGVEAREVPGRLSATHMNGRFLDRGRVETYPFRIPMSWASRRALLRSGLKLRAGVVAYGRAARRRPDEDAAACQARLLRFMGDRSFRDFLGPLPPDADALIQPSVSRSSAEPEEIAAGAGVGYFHLVWSAGEGLSRNIVGGSSVLTETLASRLGERVLTGAAVHEVRADGEGVVVRFVHDGSERQLRARHAILATPADVTREIAPALPGALDDALAQIAYGPYVVVALRTTEHERQPWDDVYAIATPKRPFNMVFNLANQHRAIEGDRREPGGSLMVYAAADLARALEAQDDEAVVRTFVSSLDEMFPGLEAIVGEAHVQRWPRGLPYVFPGRHALQPVLTAGAGPILLAGDYLGSSYTESAVQSAFIAAHTVRRST